jgi:hypothetical protein
MSRVSRARLKAVAMRKGCFQKLLALRLSSGLWLVCKGEKNGRGRVEFSFELTWLRWGYLRQDSRDEDVEVERVDSRRISGLFWLGM